MHILLIWAVLLPVLAIFWYFFVRGYVINWVGLLCALPGILLDVSLQVWLSIADSVKGFFVRKKRIKLDEYERKLS